MNHLMWVISLPDLLMVRSLPVGAAVQILHILLSSADSGLWPSPSQNHGRRGLWLFRAVEKLAEKFHFSESYSNLQNTFVILKNWSVGWRHRQVENSNKLVVCQG